MKLISKFYNHIANDSLYRNSIFLMLSTAVMAFFGFFFWIINVRLFTPEQVGIATTLISVVTLISTFSLLGLGNGLIRYLPTSVRKNSKINTAFTLVGSTSIVIAVIYLLCIKIFSPALLFVRGNAFFAVTFVMFVTFSALSNLSENVFIAYRSSLYVLLKNTVSSIIKIILPVILIGLGAYGIFSSVGIATALSFLLSIGFLVWKFNYLIKPVVDVDVVKRIFKFSLGNYVAGFIGGLSAMVLPILITNSIGAKLSAYFYMDMMIANVRFIVPASVTQAFFAEGATFKESILIHIKKAFKITYLILFPVVSIIILFGNHILDIFGKEYSANGFHLLQILALASIFLTINLIFGALLNLRHKIVHLIIINSLTVILLLSIIYLFNIHKLLYFGLTFLVTQIVESIIYSILVLIIYRKTIL